MRKFFVFLVVCFWGLKSHGALYSGPFDMTEVMRIRGLLNSVREKRKLDEGGQKAVQFIGHNFPDFYGRYLSHNHLLEKETAVALIYAIGTDFEICVSKLTFEELNECFLSTLKKGPESKKALIDFIENLRQNPLLADIKKEDPIVSLNNTPVRYAAWILYIKRVGFDYLEKKISYHKSISTHSTDRVFYFLKPSELKEKKPWFFENFKTRFEYEEEELLNLIEIAILAENGSFSEVETDARKKIHFLKDGGKFSSMIIGRSHESIREIDMLREFVRAPSININFYKALSFFDSNEQLFKAINNLIFLYHLREVGGEGYTLSFTRIFGRLSLGGGGSGAGGGRSGAGGGGSGAGGGGSGKPLGRGTKRTSQYL